MPLKDQDLETWKDKIPKHWEVKKLEQLLEYVIGGDWGKDESYDDDDYDFALCIRGTEIKNWNESRGQTAALRKIKKSNLEKRKLQLNDIILEISGGGPEQPVGRTVVIDNSVLSFKPEIPKICTNFFRLIRPSQDVSASYLNYFLTFFYKTGEITKFQAGSNNLRNLKFPDYIQIPIPLPPLAEQQSIVAKIEELFSELEKGKEQLETALAQLKVYRQSLLQAAFSGKLTHPDVKEGELPDGWMWVKLGEVGKLVSGYAFKSNDFLAKGVPVVKISNIGYSEFLWKDQEFLDKKFLNQKIDFQVKGGDLLVALTRPITNDTTKVCLYPEDSPTGLLNQRVALIKDLKVEKEYVYIFMQSSGFKEYIRSKFSETLQPNLSPKDLSLTPIPCGEVKEQKLIVQILESKLTVCDKIEETIQQSLAQADVLRQSILKQAFEGKLVRG
ncbi:restriction endonuclease subunit S [Leptospira paudalimensis]|uniref:Restriction endonuclease subunit S n=1 Tax=Leptospira paudalimensis TaxID=2950024 RepID=A0ABT3M5F2_9LEPT|nr:restriction endonuclease subunit S [Leptospira paudalimensis]MCW7503267.1 restriction endonuclease subunit S [Leptospira paudalimensis]